ncbi:hypothetical protein ACIA5E_26875 [Nocardia asteroides]|uniref:hypothetical protein n=1 Tax=Nocardia asteroides TaxID=1824 RepID=UPI0037B5A5FF
MSDERKARELEELDTDVSAALAAIEPADMVGPIVSANGMWATLCNGSWRVTVDRDGTAEPVSWHLAYTLEECRRWAGAQLRDSQPCG